jgi:O-antigen/teichoic acid export membrane protein
MTSADVGIYRIVFQLTALVTISVMAIQSVIYPKISNWYANNEIATIQKTIKSALSFSFVFAIPVCIGGWVLGDYLLYFLYGSSFESGVYALLILFATQIACIFMLLFTCTLNATDQPKETFFIALMSGIINISLNVILIPVFGIVGAAIASLVSMCLNALFAFIVLTRKIFIAMDIPRISKVVIASMMMGVCVLGYRVILTIPDIFHLILVILIGACIYFLVLLKIDKELFEDCQEIISHFLM